MTNLREEIHDCLDGLIDPIEQLPLTINILSKIEKKIDVLKQDYEEPDRGSEKQSIAVYYQLLGIQHFYENVKEMLK